MPGFSQNVLKSMRSLASDALYRLSRRDELPVVPQGDDLYLVEFPKSGITWLRFLVANTNLLLNEDGRSVTFFNINDFVPDIHASRFVGTPILAKPGFRFIKSHSIYNRHYCKTVYLVRDPRNVMPSYYNFLVQLGWYGGTLDEMLEHSCYGIEAWCRHVTGWLDNAQAAHAFWLIRYEDLLKDPGAIVSRLYKFIGYDLPDELVAAAVLRSNKEVMRAEEEIFFEAHPALSTLEFVRKDSMGGARVSLSPANLKRIESAAAPLMSRLSYAPTND